MFSKKISSAEKNAEDVEFEADSDSLIALEHRGETDSFHGDFLPQDYQFWMSALLRDVRFQEYFDVEFKLKKTISGNEQHGSVSAHKLILATRNSQFAELLRKEKGRDIFLFEPDISAEIFKALIQYIYTGEIEFPRKVVAAASLMYAAKKYQVEPLYSDCKIWILNRIPRAQPRHLVLLFQRALDLHLDDLIPLCTLLVEQRTVDTVKDPQFMGVKANFIGRILDLNAFTGISEREMFERVLHWGQARLAENANVATNVKGKDKEGPTLRSILDPFIHKFCLVSIPKDPLAAIITESGIFTEKEQLDISLFLLGRKKDLGQFSARVRKVNHKDLVALQMAPPAATSKPSRKGIKNGFKNLVQKSKSVTDLSKLGTEGTETRRRRTSQISMPIGPPEHKFALHADLNYFIDDISRTDNVVRNILANLPKTPSCSSASSSRAGEERSNWFRTNFTDLDSSPDLSLPQPFVRRIYRKTKLITIPPTKPNRKSLNSVFSLKNSVDI